MEIDMKKTDAQWLDQMYNNRARVPEAAAILQRWADLSAAARASESRRLDLRYGTAPSETLDLFPSPRAGAPVLVFIHGGYWRALDKADHSFVAPAFTRAGACVLIPNYALCPGTATHRVTVPGIVMQMVAALAWTWRNIALYGGDPGRITVVGHSAGGHLAAMLLACHWKAFSADLPGQLVKNALSISGLHDLEPIRNTPFLANDLKLTPAQVRKASPALLPRPAAGRLYSVAGADESAEFLRQNLLIRKAWGAVRVPRCEALPGLNHFSVLDALTQPGHRLHRLALELLQQGPMTE
jgi:arylformamidase